MEFLLSAVDFVIHLDKHLGEIIQAFGKWSYYLDYIRYPYPVPSIPDGRFVKFGVAYGYGERNVERFMKTSGLDPGKGRALGNIMRGCPGTGAGVFLCVSGLAAVVGKRHGRLCCSHELHAG